MAALEKPEPVTMEEAKLAIELRNNLATKEMQANGLSAEDAEAIANIRMFVLALRSIIQEHGENLSDEATEFLKGMT